MTEFVFWTFAALALALGFKHAFDVDHVVAVSNILTRRRTLDDALSLSASWAAGHLVTAALVSAAVYYLASTWLVGIGGKLELLVPVMLVAVGLFGLLVEAKRVHVHRHRHAAHERPHRHVHSHFRSTRHDHGAMAGIGVVHGLASNDELLMVLLVGLAATSWWQVGAGVALFSLGVLMGMMVYASGIHATRRLPGSQWLPTVVTVAFSVASIAYAGYLLAGGTGLNLLPAL